MTLKELKEMVDELVQENPDKADKINLFACVDGKDYYIDSMAFDCGDVKFYHDW